MYATLEDWIEQESIPLSFDSPGSFNGVVDKLMSSLGDSIELLGFGEALHGGSNILTLRNRLFQRLAEDHGYSTIAIESSFPRGRTVNEYVGDRGAGAYDAVMDAGFSHGFGRFEANRELVEWMRSYNADPAHRIKLSFYGFDSPTEMWATDSPRRVLHFVLDYLGSIDSPAAQKHRQRIDELLGEDADWENPAAMMDPTKSMGLSADANALRIETEELILELHVRRPELVAKSDERRYLEAVRHGSMARQLLNYHAIMARQSSDRVARGLGLRDAMMADNLEYIVCRERGRGKVFAFAHNSHLKRGKAEWQLGPELQTWWPAGAHLDGMFGEGYAVIGSAVGVSTANGISEPEAGSLEALLTAAQGPPLFIPTHHGRGIPVSEIATTRSGSMKNFSYFPLTPQSLSDFDWLAVLDSTGYDPGAPPLP